MFGRQRDELRRELDTVRAESEADSKALSEIIGALGRAESAEQVVSEALTVIRRNFGWTYGSYWQVDPDQDALVLCDESGSVSEEYSTSCRSMNIRKGVGLIGKVWQRADLVCISDLSVGSDGPRVGAAQRAGLRSGISFPLVRDGQVVGTMDFFDTTIGEPSVQRIAILRIVGAMVSQSFRQLSEQERQQEDASDVRASNAVMRVLGAAPDGATALRSALEKIREPFEWAYGSYWSVDAERDTLVFNQESGEISSEFREVTRTATFDKGVGVAGRTWQHGSLLEVPDLGEVTDCVRAPPARRAGVKSGVCMVITVFGAVVGTMDFFVTRSQALSESRRTALQNMGSLVGQALERFASANHLDDAAQMLIDSICEVKSNIDQATTIAVRGRDLSESTNARMATLSRASGEISNVVHVIQEIAAQTNLLALNATIEAARAGDAGKGIAVVAGEVKELASETACATTEVEAKVAAIREEVSAITDALVAIAGAVTEINDSQETITGVVNHQNDLVRTALGENSRVAA